MRTGKVSGNIINRSVLKTIKYKNSEYILMGALPGGDASISIDGTVMASAAAGLMFGEEMLLFDIKRALANGVNNVAVAGGRPKAVNVNLILPKKTQEQDIKTYMRYISGLCEEMGIEIAGGDTEVTLNVSTPIIVFNVYGDYIYKKFEKSTEIAKAGMELILIGDIAMSGTASIVYLKKDDLNKRFQSSYIKLALQTENAMNISKEAVLLAEKYDIKIMHDLSRGGIYSAIWQLSEKVGMGVEVYLDKISIRQETIEVCELFTINPYKLISNGAFFAVCENAKKLVAELRNDGINASIVGKLREDFDKVILKGEEKRYVEPPKGDEIYNIIL